MHYVKDVFENKQTQHAHDKFVRYSKGSFVGALLSIKQTSTNIKVSTSFHLIDELLFLLVETIGNEEVHVKGSVVWNSDLSEELYKLGIKYSKVTKARGIFKYVLDNNVKFKDFVEAMSSYNLLVSFKHGDISMSCKSSFPKPNKEFGNDFCKCQFPKEMAGRIFDEFAFDIKERNPKVVSITHHIEINDIVLPEDAATFEEARRRAIRKGTIKRKIIADKEELETSTEFSV